jgi:hypothetical protein
VADSADRESQSRRNPSSMLGYASVANNSRFMREVSATQDVMPARTISRFNGDAVPKTNAAVSHRPPAIGKIQSGNLKGR